MQSWNALKTRKEAPENKPIENAPLIDTSLIDYMLSLSYEARLELNGSAIQLVDDLQEAGKKLYAKKLKGNS